jgi:hypothetical protein
LCLLGIGRQICPSAIGIVVCIFLCLLGIGRQICRSAIGIVVCIFLFLLGLGRQICPSAIGIVVCIFLCLLGIGRQIFQVQLELELELLDVSSFVIQKQISPLGCALLHNTKTNLWWVFGSQFLSLNMGNHRIRERNSSRKKKPIEKVEEEREKEKLCMSKRRLSEEGNPISSGIDAAIVSPPSPEEKRKSSLERNPNNISSRNFLWMTR